MLKRVISLILSLVMVLGMMPLNIMATAEEISVPETTAPVEAESVPEETVSEETFGEISGTVPVETAPTYDASGSILLNGTCGENVRWSLYSDGELVISGSGAMENFTSSYKPWNIADNPSQIKKVTIQNGVTSIGDYAFQGLSNLTSVSIANSVKSIGEAAFNACTSLYSITIGNGVTSIGDNAFSNCTYLGEVSLGSAVTSIGTYAFQHCNCLTEIVFPKSVSSIGDWAFLYCYGLNTITFEGDAPSIGKESFYPVTANAYYSANNETWTEEVRQNYGGTITWKSYETGPKIIASGTFGDNLTWTLDDEGKLTVSGEGYMTWSGNAPWYDYRDSVKTAVIEDGITGLVSNAFSRYENLTTVKLSDTVGYIGEHAFAWCDSLTDVTMSSAVTEIREGAFRNCGSLTHITIPATVSSICSYAFAYCANLSGITVDEANPYYSSDENGVLFNEAKTQLLKCPGTLSGTYTIPDSVTEIEACAFSSCASLTGVEIPDALRVIESYAFDGCTGLTEVTLPASVTTLGTKTFDNCTELQKIYFEGNAPKHFAGNKVVDLFGSTTATVYYPADNETWTEEVRQNYGGTVTWKLYCVGEHTEVIDAGVAATCTTDGLTVGKHCSACDEVLVKQEVIPAGHTVTYGICPNCGVFVGGSPYLQLLPDTFFSCENLYTKLNPVKGYYTATKYDTSNGDVISVVIPVEPGDRIAASSFGSVSENMGTVNGIRVTYLKGDTIVTSVSANVVYDTYTKNGYITVPDGVDAVCIPWWAPSNANWMTLAQISKNYSVHSPVSAPAQAPTCTENGYTAGEICEICGISLGTREEIPADGHKYSGNSCTICGAVNLMAILDGKYVSVLGDSISTFNGYSNDATVNSTIGGNAPRYDAGSADTKPGSYCLLESVNSTWWMGFADRSGMKLLVNNSWAGSQVFGGQTSDGRIIPPAYLERCVNLHDNTTDNNPDNEPICPDVIFVYLGINDYNFNRDQVGSGAVDYANLVNSDGTYVVPSSFGEAYGILLHKMQAAYPNAQIFAMTLLPENLYSVNMTAWEQHNAYIRAAAQYYNVPVVDLASDCAITWENYSGYMIDKIHPTTAGMKLIADCIEETLQAYYKANPPHTHTPVIDEAVEATCTSDGLTEGKHCSTCGEVLVAQKVIPAGHTVENGICTGCEAYGTCGANLTWTLNEDGVLTVSGTGAMNNYVIYSADAPWHKHQESVKKVVIGEGVTSIGAYAFNNHQNLAEVIIPDSVTEIGDHAFISCDQLTIVNLPDSLTRIENAVFFDCDGLTAIVIPDSVTAIDNEAFYHCSGLKKVTIGNSVKEIAHFAFGYCVGLTEVVIPDSVSSIGQGAFAGCSSLESITIPFVGDSEKTAADTNQYPFGYIFGTNSYEGSVAVNQFYYEDPSMDSRTNQIYYIPASLRSVTVTGGEILLGAFSNCADLTTILLPEDITTIGVQAFDSCRSLETIVIPATVTEIGQGAFQDCSNLNNVHIPESVTSIGSSAFEDCVSLTEIEIKQQLSLQSYTFFGCTKLHTAILSGVTEIGYRAFYGCIALKNVTLGENLRSIGDSAFEECVSLSGIEIPDSVETIDEYAFFNCSLTEITLPESVRSIGDFAFRDCKLLEEIWFEGGAPEIAAYSLDNVRAKAYYPAGNETWTEDVMQNYGGTITWVPVVNGAATVGGVGYATVAEALKAAKAGDTVQLLQDTEAAEVIVKDGIILDLNGYALTADYVFAVNGANIVDNSSDNTSLLIVSENNVMISKSNSQLPVWTGEGFVFTEITKFQEVYRTTAEGLPQYIFSPTFESIAHQYLVQGAESSRIRIAIRMTWEIETGTAFQNFVFNDATVKTIIDSFTGSYYKSAFYATITDSKYANFKLQVIMISDTGVELACN